MHTQNSKFYRAKFKKCGYEQFVVRLLKKSADHSGWDPQMPGVLEFLFDPIEAESSTARFSPTEVTTLCHWQNKTYDQSLQEQVRT